MKRRRDFFELFNNNGDDDDDNNTIIQTNNVNTHDYIPNIDSAQTVDELYTTTDDVYNTYYTKSINKITEKYKKKHSSSSSSTSLSHSSESSIDNSEEGENHEYSSVSSIFSDYGRDSINSSSYDMSRDDEQQPFKKRKITNTPEDYIKILKEHKVPKPTIKILISEIKKKIIYENENKQKEINKEKRRKEREKKYSFNKCFLCLYGNTQHDKIEAHHMVNLINIIDDQYGHGDDDQVGYSLHKYFKDNIYRKEYNIPMLTTEMATAHIQSHTLNPNLYIGNEIRQWRKEAYIQRQQIHSIDGKSDEKKIKLVLEICKWIRDLQHQDPKKMNFYNPNLKIDLPSRFGSYLNIEPEDQDRLFQKKQENDKKKPNRGITKFSILEYNPIKEKSIKGYF